MKKQITLASILLYFSFFIKAQNVHVRNDSVQIDTVRTIEYTDDTPVGLGIRLRGEQMSLQNNNIFNAVLTPPTVIEKRTNERGELYFKAYINADEIEVIAKKLTSETAKRYKVFEKVSFYFNGKPSGSPRSLERVIIPSSDKSNAYSVIQSNEVRTRVNHTYTVIDVKSGKEISTLRIDYVFPKPVPELLTIDQKWISRNEDRPGDNLFFDPVLTNKVFKEQINANNLVKTGFDPETNLPDQLLLPSEINTFLIRFRCLLGNGIRETYLEYKLSIDTSWRTTVKKENPFLILRNLEPGKYKLLVRYPGQDDRVMEYEFEITRNWMQTTTFKVSAGSLATFFVCLGVFAYHAKTQKARLEKEVNNRKHLQYQITSLRSQLQPHFVFNALSSIQSLINKNDIEGANLYMSRFGSLLHEILDKSDKTLHPLATEIRQIEYYLQLEQLRFKFQYKIEIDNTINISEIDIPVMLLQPFVENAIKHGIPNKREMGRITVFVKKQNNELVIKVQDNGDGYEVAKVKTGFGNALVQERVNALNRFFYDQHIEIKSHSAVNEGTIVSIHFSNWLVG